MTELLLTIGGLNCGHCVQTVTAAIEAVDGVKVHEIDLATGRARLEVPDADPAIVQRVCAAVKQSGYQVHLGAPPADTSDSATSAEENSPLPERRLPVVSLSQGLASTLPAPPATTSRAEAEREVVCDLFDVNGMHCASCTSRIESALAQQPGVRAAHANLATNQVSVEYAEGRIDRAAICAAIKRAGYTAAPAPPPEQAARHMAERQRRLATAWRRRLAVAGSLLTALMLVGWLVPDQWSTARGWLQWLLATPIQLYVGWPYYRGAWQRLRHGGTNMDTLVVLGTTTAYVAGVAGLLHATEILTFRDAAMILTFITLGKYLEVVAKGRASDAIRRLLELAPPEVTVLGDDQQPVRVAVEKVRIGQTILVRPGEKIPLDAEIVAGNSSVDEAWLTGESMPVDKQPNDTIYAGTINGNGSLTARVIRDARQTALAQMIELVRKAQESKADVQRLADRVVGVFVPVVMTIAALSLLVWLMLGDPHTALTCLVSVLIVACPCALGLATPTAVLVASGRGAELGILIKEAHALEQAGRIDTAVLDKTGTITRGQPEVVQLLPAAGHTEHDLLRAAAAAEQHSGHPLSAAILAKAKQLHLQPVPADRIELAPGEGIIAQRAGAEIVVGTETLLQRRHVDLMGLADERVERGRAAGGTVVFVAERGTLLGAVVIEDPIAPHSAPAIEQLKTLGLEVIMLSGDKQPTAAAVADQVGIQRVLAEVPPDQKQRVVERLRDEGRVVAMVGDGINDAAALAAADLGIAIGGGADIAVESGDIVLLHRDLRDVGRAIRLARLTRRKIHQNLAWALVYNVTLLPLAAGLVVPLLGRGVLTMLPAFSAAAMALSSVSVVSNSLLLRYHSVAPSA